MIELAPKNPAEKRELLYVDLPEQPQDRESFLKSVSDKLGPLSPRQVKVETPEALLDIARSDGATHWSIEMVGPPEKYARQKLQLSVLKEGTYHLLTPPSQHQATLKLVDALMGLSAKGKLKTDIVSVERNIADNGGAFGETLWITRKGPAGYCTIQAERYGNWVEWRDQQNSLRGLPIHPDETSAEPLPAAPKK